MAKCNVCGQETAKCRLVCKGCYAAKKVGKNMDKTSNTNFNTAAKHLSKNPGLLNISWPSFNKK